MQVIDTKVKRNNVAIDHKIYQTRLAVSWLTNKELFIEYVELTGALPELTITEPTDQQEMQMKALQVIDGQQTK